jgi:putative tryptophan/tyrosine transport system substrate-binding protein
MRRREFLGVLGSAAAAWPLAARAQQSERVRRIGFLMGLPESDPEGRARVAAFRQGLQELKWTEGDKVRIDIRWGTGDAARFRADAAELVSLGPDVLLGSNTPPAQALKQATQTIPIVFAGVSDPIGDGIVTNLSMPGGNITGFSSFDSAMAGKWLQILKEILPGIGRVTVMFNPDTAPHSVFWPALEAAAPSVGVTLVRVTVRDVAAIEAAIGALAGDLGGGLVIMPDVFTGRHRALIYALAARHKVPTIYEPRYHPAAGGLMSYGPDFVDQHRQAASYVDRILKGEKPGDLPVQTPTKFEFVINLKAAKALGISIPLPLLGRADEVIE